MIPVQDALGDWVCEHGRSVDVHCCGCHSGFLFDIMTCVCLNSEGGQQAVTEDGLAQVDGSTSVSPSEEPER